MNDETTCKQKNTCKICAEKWMKTGKKPPCITDVPVLKNIPVAQRTERLPTKQDAEGSNPSRDAIKDIDLSEIEKALGSPIPHGLTLKKEDDFANFLDEDGFCRLTMPWEDYLSLLKWYSENK